MTPLLSPLHKTFVTCALSITGAEDAAITVEKTLVQKLKSVTVTVYVPDEIDEIVFVVIPFDHK